MQSAQENSNTHVGEQTPEWIALLTRLEQAIIAREGGSFDTEEVWFRCPMPDHEDAHPSARYNTSKNAWCCDVCKVGGGANNLAERLGVADPGLTLRTYAAEKRLQVEFLERMGLSDGRFNKKPAVRMAYRNPDGTEAATRFRTGLVGRGRFAWSKGAKAQLYGLDQIDDVRRAGEVTLVEGESDAQTLWFHGEPALGIPGAGNWNEQRDASHLSKIETIYIVVEPDRGGETIRRWLGESEIRDRVLLIDLTPFGVKDVSALHCLDPDQFPERWAEAKVAAVSVTDVTHVTGSEGEGDGNVLLDDVLAYQRRFVSYPSDHAAVAHALWITHTHLMKTWDSTPRLAFLSPEPASGKTRALEVTELLVPNPVLSINVSPAYLIRKVGDQHHQPTVLHDEIDTVFGPKAGDHEDVRALINAGHRKGATAGRCVVSGAGVQTVEFPAYCAVVVAGLGDLPDTILSRSVVIRMRRRRPAEKIEPYRPRNVRAAGIGLRDRLHRWARGVESKIGDPWPEMPKGIDDRDADMWEALIAVADAAGGEWPTRARDAAVALVAESKESTPGVNIRLLSDLRTVFGDREHMHTDTILHALHAVEEAPWGEQRYGRTFLNKTELSKRLKEFGITTKIVRVGDKVQRGYKREDFFDTWDRYLGPLESRDREEHTPSPIPPDVVTSVTPVTDGQGALDELVLESLVDDGSAPRDASNGSSSKFVEVVRSASVDEVIDMMEAQP